ncbi:MAG: hypothetical protein RLZZ524_2295 [Pseudomonadota bacterium]
MDFLPVASLRPDLTHLLPGLLDPRLDALVVEVAMDFCRRTLFSQETVGPYGMIENDNVLTLDAPDASRTTVTQAISGTVQGLPLEAASEAQLNRIAPNWRTISGRPTHFIAVDRTSVRLVPTPAETVADAIYLQVAVVPRVGATVIDRRVVEEFRQALVDGVLARAYAHPNKPYSSPGLVELHRGLYETQVSEAKARASAGFHSVALRADPRRVA